MKGLLPMAADFEPCLAFTLREEGGWSDNPSDPGGSTQRGVTLATLTAWRKAKDEPSPTVADLRNISMEETTAIYATEYWNVLHGTALPAGIDLMVFDFGVNAGPKRSALMLQRALNLPTNQIDGWIGPKTIEATGKADVLILLSDIAYRQQTFYFASPNYVSFGHGWMVRVNRRLISAWELAKNRTALTGGIPMQIWPHIETTVTTP